MGINLCSTLGDEQMTGVLAGGYLPPVLGVNAGGGRRLPPRESGGIYHQKNLDILHKKSRYSA